MNVVLDLGDGYAVTVGVAPADPDEPALVKLEVDDSGLTTGTAAGAWLTAERARELSLMLFAAAHACDAQPWHSREGCDEGPDCSLHGGRLCGLCGSRYAADGHTACGVCA